MRGRYFVVLGPVIFLLAACTLRARDSQKPGQAPVPSEPPAPSLGQVPNLPHNYNITPEDKARKNPVSFTEVSVARGKRIFLTQCAMCHGTNGDGKGDLAQEMKITPPDFTKPDTLKKRTDGELFKIIGIGNGSMPGQEKRMTDTQRWNIINYLRALGGGVPEKVTGKAPEENIIEIPQDQHR
jgi:mono/diheme cytochrome c family protein